MKLFFNHYINDLFYTIKNINITKLENIINILIDTKNKKKKVFLIGNGGSSSTSSHVAQDWSKELKIRTICLTDNSSLITAWANDTKYDNIFKAQLEIHLDSEDILIAYSGSGNSPNIIKAIEYANSIGCKTIGMTGNYDKQYKNKLANISDISLIVPSKSMEKIEDVHLIINHIIKEYIKNWK